MAGRWAMAMEGIYTPIRALGICGFTEHFAELHKYSLNKSKQPGKFSGL